MVPETVLNPKIFFQEYDTSLDSLSIPQANYYFGQMLERLRYECKIYEVMAKNRYYVVLLSDADELRLIKGDHFLNFSIALPKEEVLRKIARERVPSEDIFATAVEIENLFRHFLSIAQASFKRYAQYLSTARDPMNVTRESLFTLMHTTYEMKSLHEIKLKQCTVERQSRFLRVLIRELSRQLEAISLVLAVRNIA